MKRPTLSIIYIFFTALAVFGQTQKAPIKSISNKPVQNQPTRTPDIGKVPDANRIPDSEWNEIVKASEAEDWSRAATLISESLKKIKIENETKQLARLRYLYLYALAGEVLQGKMTYDELEKIADTFIGQDFLMPSREVAAICDKKLNYICPVKNSGKVLRVTTINKAATSIISFEYVVLPEKFDFAANNGKKIFLGGRLQKIEPNPDDSNISVMRLFFENGVLLMRDDTQK